MTVLADLDGDIDAWVRIKAKDLSGPHRYLQIAQALCQHGRSGDALAWAERGLQACGHAPELLTFCIQEALNRGIPSRRMSWRGNALRRIRAHPRSRP
ncbi:hypothetical protein ACFSUI_16035 [Ralstonia solanacearum]